MDRRSWIHLAAGAQRRVYGTRRIDDFVVNMITVPKRWPGETVVLIGGGPSLTVADVEAVERMHSRGLVRAIAINNAYLIAPWADVLYAADAKWWGWHVGVPSFTGPKYALDISAPIPYPDVQLLQNTGFVGLELEPTGLRAGYNSGYQAINLAVHFGAKRILLLGYDMRPAQDGRTHWHGDHPDHQPSPYAQMISAFGTLLDPLKELGVSVINCSRRTALTCFPCATIEDALMERAA